MEKESKTKIFFPLFGVICIVLCCYSPIFFNDFLDAWDDQWMIFNPFTENGLNMRNVSAVFCHSIQGQYSPLVELNYVFLYNLFGYNPFWFHLTSLVWHCACVLLAFAFMRRVLIEGGVVCQKASQIAMIASFLFAIHPVNVESVAWASALKVPMYAFFYLASLLCYIRYCKSQKMFFYISTLVCFICSGFSKEQAFVLPLSLILLDWFMRRNLKNIDLWLEKIPFFAIGIGLALLTWSLQNEDSTFVKYTITQRILLGCYSLFEYITKSFVPINLNYLYPFPVFENSAFPIQFYVYPALVICLIISIFSFRKKRILLFGVLFFILNLLLSLHIVSIPRHGIVADRYLYISLIGMMLVFSYYLLVALKNAKWKKMVVILLGGYIIYLVGYTYMYSQKWKNTTTVKEYLWKFTKERY